MNDRERLERVEAARTMLGHLTSVVNWANDAARMVALGLVDTPEAWETLCGVLDYATHQLDKARTEALTDRFRLAALDLDDHARARIAAERREATGLPMPTPAEMQG